MQLMPVCELLRSQRHLPRQNCRKIRLFQFFKKISVIMRLNLFGASMNLHVVRESAEVCWSRAPKRAKLGHACDYTECSILDRSEVANGLDLGPNLQRE